MFFVNLVHIRQTKTSLKRSSRFAWNEDPPHKRNQRPTHRQMLIPKKHKVEVAPLSPIKTLDSPLDISEFHAKIIEKVMESKSENELQTNTIELVREEEPFPLHEMSFENEGLKTVAISEALIQEDQGIADFVETTAKETNIELYFSFSLNFSFSRNGLSTQFLQQRRPHGGGRVNPHKPKKLL